MSPDSGMLEIARKFRRFPAFPQAAWRNLSAAATGFRHRLACWPDYAAANAGRTAMNLRQLKYFLSVVDTGNMTRAAEQLHVAQTALGMQIRQLEDSLGVALLVRHSRGVERPRPAAAARARHRNPEARRTDPQGVSSWQPAADSETLRLGITPALMLIVGTEIALTARERLPDVSLSLVEAMSHVLSEHAAARRGRFHPVLRRA